MSNKSKRKMVSFKLEDDTYEALMKLVAKTNLSQSELLRKFVKKGLAVESYDENQQMLFDTVQNALKSLLNPAIDRIVSLNVRGEILNAQTYFLLLNFFDTLGKATGLVTTEEVLEKTRQARTKGVRYMGLKDGDLARFLEKEVLKTLNLKEKEEKNADT